MENNMSTDTRLCLSNTGIAERRGCTAVLSRDKQVDGPPCSDSHALSHGFGVNPTP